MPERRIIHVPGDRPREVWLWRARTIADERLYGVSATHWRPFSGPWYGTEGLALDAFADQIREEIELQKLDDYNDKRGAES